MKKSYMVYMQVASFEPVFLTKFKIKSEAEAYIRLCEKQDRYKVEVEKYAMPKYGYAKYYIQ